MDDAHGSLDYAFYLTMDEVLDLIVQHSEKVRDAEDYRTMGVHLKMACMAMTCALKIYGSQIAVPEQELK